MTSSDRVAIPGSTRTAVQATPAGEVDPGEQTSVTVYLRGPEPKPGERLSREEWAARYGAGDADVALVEQFATAHGLVVSSVEAGRRAVVLNGRVEDFATAFGTGFAMFQDGEGRRFRAREGALSVPSALAQVVTAVVGLDERPQARTMWRKSHATSAGLSPAAVAQAYSFPSGTDGAGQTVALIELGGGYREADLTEYFAGLGISAPSLASVAVDRGSNSPGAANGPDGEVMLDIEVVGAAAPAAAIAVYFAPNTDQGFIDAVSTAVHDTARRPSVVSISWGGPEDSWTAQAAQQMEQVFAQAAALGVTVTVASGDNGSSDGVSDGASHVDFPASAPHALACGGTRLQISPAGPIESVWNEQSAGGGATGGGISDLFGLPTYQASAHVPPSANPGAHAGRGVPDVAGNADPQTGYHVRVDGQDMVIGGTSAVAPLWAALIARINQALGHDAGDIHAAIYASTSAFHDVTAGSNGAYVARVGWDPCTGLGTPDGDALLAAFKGAGV